jgi:hypothetical protein
MKLRYCISVFFLIFLSLCAFSLEFQLQGHYDNYENNNPERNYNIGLSFQFKEQIKNNVFVDANLIYKNQNKYLAYCAGQFKIKQFIFLSGIALDIKNTFFSPGLLLKFDYKIVKWLSLSTELLTTFSTIDVSKGSVFDGVAGFIFHLKNANVKLAYDFRREMINTYYISYHKGIFDLITYESGFPLRIGLNAHFYSIIDSRNPTSKNLILEAGGKLELVTPRHGSYFITGNAKILELANLQGPITFGIGAGTRFNIN